jgi:transcriptional regulator with XRE-family HTH domain
VVKAQDGSIDAAIGGRIRSLRIHHELSQAQLAKKLGVTYQQVQKYESGRNQVNPTRLFQLAEIFGVSASVLLGEKPAKNSGSQLPSLFAVDLDKEAVSMFEAFQKLKDRKLRRQVSMLTQSLARSGGGP